MRCTLAELPHRMTSEEYSAWLYDWMQNPWGEQRDLIHAAYIAMTVINFAGKSIKQPVKLETVVSSMQGSIHQMLNPVEIGPDDIFGKFGD